MSYIVNNLLAESRVSDFQKKYADKINQSDFNKIIGRDPSRNYKYIDWAGKILSKDSDLDVDDLMSDIALFHNKIRGRDIYSLKNYDQLHDLVHPARSEKLTKRQQLYRDATVLLNDDHWLIVAPNTHEQSRFFGGSTSWCISTSNSEHWNDYYDKNGNELVFVIDRTKKQGDSHWKVCVVSGPGDNDVEDSELRDVYDRIISGNAKKEYIKYLGDSVVQIIDDHLYYHEGTSRQQEYQDKEEQEKIDKYIEDNALNDLVKYYFKYYLDRLPDYIKYALDEDEMVQFLKDNIKEETLDSIISRFAYNQTSHSGTDGLGWIPDKTRFDKYLTDDDRDDEHDIFYYYANEYVFKNRSLIAFHEYISSAMNSVNYNNLMEQFDLNSAIEDVISKHYRVINAANQMHFPSWPVSIERVTVHNLNDVLNLFKKYGHTQLADAIVAYSTGHLREIKYKKMATLIHL